MYTLSLYVVLKDEIIRGEMMGVEKLRERPLQRQLDSGRAVKLLELVRHI